LFDERNGADSGHPARYNRIQRARMFH